MNYNMSLKTLTMAISIGLRSFNYYLWVVYKSRSGGGGGGGGGWKTIHVFRDRL